MKKIGLLLAVLLAGLAPASAQVSVTVSLDQEQFLPGEAILAAIRIVNHSGKVLRLGAEANWLRFTVESRGSTIVPQHGDVPVTNEFFLGSSKVATKWVNLAPYFSISTSGRYTVTAVVHVQDLGRDFTSPPKSFDVIEGTKIWEQEIGVTNPTNNVTEVRHYVLQQANYLKNQLELYLRVTDATGKTRTVFPIGPMVSFGVPEPQVDKFNNLHVLYQDKAHSFSYSVFDSNGAQVSRQIYDYSSSRPRLQPDNDGKIIVKGGALRTNPDDDVYTNQPVNSTTNSTLLFPGVTKPWTPPPATNSTPATKEKP
jgi:hypothetical protein